MQQLTMDFDALAQEARRIEQSTAPAFLEWQGQRVKVNWMRQVRGTFHQAGVSFPDHSATLLAVKVQDGQFKPVLCWCHGPRIDGVMSEDERQARAAMGNL